MYHLERNIERIRKAEAFTDSRFPVAEMAEHEAK